MATLTHAQYNSPMQLYSKDNVQEVLNQVTGYPNPQRPHSAMSGTFDPNQSHVYRYLQSGGHLPPAHSARYDEQSSEHPRYKGFVDPNVQSPSFKRLQYVTGVDSGAEDEITPEVHPPPRSRTEDVRSGANSRQSGQGQSEGGQPIALGYAPISGGGGQQQQYSSQYEQQQYQQLWTDSQNGPPVTQRDPTTDNTERDHPLDPTFAARIAEAERPKVPPPVVPSWTRYAEKKRDRWQQHTGQTPEPQQQPPPQNPAQFYRPPQSSQHTQPQYTLDSSRSAQDKWQAHYAPYRFESGTTAASATERPRSRSVEPYGGVRKYGGNKEWMKPFIAPNLRWQYGHGVPQQNYNFSIPLGGGGGHKTTTTENYSQYYGGSQPGGGSQYGGGVSPHYGGGTQSYSNLSTSNQQQNRISSYDPSQQPPGGRSSSTYEYTSSTTQGGGLGGAPSAGGFGQGGHSSTKDSQYSRRVYESQKHTTSSGTDYQPQQNRQVAIAAPWTGSSSRTETQSQSLFQSENEARRQRQLMEQEVMKRAASAGPAPASDWKSSSRHDTTSTTVNTTNPSWRQRPAPQENRITTYTTTSGQGPRWQQAPGAETKSQSSGSYLDEQGNKVNFTKEVYTSSDPGKEFSMLTEQEKKILEEPLQPGVVSRHITTKYYKKSTYTSSTTTNTSQTPSLTTTATRHAIQGKPILK